MNEENKVDRRDLKIEALRQRIATLTMQYEDQAADARVIITELEASNQELEWKIAELQREETVESVEAEVVEETPEA